LAWAKENYNMLIILGGKNKIVIPATFIIAV
jgi:hypothetical protein